MIAFVARDRGGDQSGKKDDATDEVSRPEFKKMRDSFEQRISKIDRSEAGKEDEESAMVGVIVSLVIDEFVQSGFRRKRTIDARYKMVGEIRTNTKSKNVHDC